MVTGFRPASGSSGHRCGGMALVGVAGKRPAASARGSATPFGFTWQDNNA
jgi:hypothetical protein